MFSSFRGKREAIKSDLKKAVKQKGQPTRWSI